MAQQLIQDRTPAAYAGVEAYARAHAKEDAGALAWLAVGYAHVIDHEYAKAIDPLNRAKPLAGDLGDYVAYYLGLCYLQTGRQAEGMATLATFSSAYPDSLLARDAHLAYANGLLSEGRAAEAAEILEKDRLPVRSDIEFAVGKAYAALGQTSKAAEAFSNVYFNMPSSPDADNAYSELIKLHGAPPTTVAQRKARAELLIKARRYADAAAEFGQLAANASPETRPEAELAQRIGPDDLRPLALQERDLRARNPGARRLAHPALYDRGGQRREQHDEQHQGVLASVVRGSDPPAWMRTNRWYSFITRRGYS